MEALETKTLFGELDHPEGDRCETLAKNAAISITKLEKRPEEGVIYGEADILDTPLIVKLTLPFALLLT